MKVFVMFDYLTKNLTKIFLYFCLKILEKTYRFRIYDEENRLLARNAQGAYLLACWHEHILSVLMTQKGHPFYTLASQSPAGRMIGYQCERYHYKVVYGSQDRSGRDKGGLRALLSLSKLLKNGHPVALTVDGSVGPRREVKAGIIDLARRTQTAILPIASAASRQWVLPSWDQFKLPKPFATVVVQYGAPVLIPENLHKDDIPTWQKKVAAIIDEQEIKALKIVAIQHAV
jgi:lysophospholipid acyltransferase (LPLAT)-like uncharacterized protein